MRALTVLVALVALLASAPAYAKGPALTWEINPETPAAGHPASIVLRTWEWTAEGEPDTTRPSRTGLFDHDVLRLPIRAYPASLFPHIGPGEVGVGVGRMVRIYPSVYRGTISFPRPGDWVVAWRGYHPGAPDRPDTLLLAVRVADAEQRPWVTFAVGTGGIALAALALTRRQTRKREGSTDRAHDSSQPQVQP